ncbi:MAG: dTDP-4-dehydrorhamnose reductase [bacterium]|nr:dTDP-4-dehydrorhamnose reductase [bacterium]
MSQKEKKKILITGASGMLGKALVNKLTEYTLIPTDLPNLDISKSNAAQLIINKSPDYVLHLAAYTDVDGCEKNTNLAQKTNAEGTKNVALACKKINIPLLYISTDYVFDGQKQTPYNEWDKTNPINVYGKTKEDGEKSVKTLLNKYWIVRTSGLYGKEGKNFVDTIITKAKELKFLKVVNDQFGSPTYVDHLSTAIKELIKTEEYGIYHITNSDYCSWYEFAKSIVDIANIQCEIQPISSDELTRPAKRPKNWRLAKFFLENTIKKPLPSWYSAVEEYIKSNKNKKN